MSRKKYPWKTRYARLSHRGRREGRKPRNLAPEEHLARAVYDELRNNSPHEHIETPCYGLDPDKVRKGNGGSEAYRRTAYALLNKTRLHDFLDERGLDIKQATELVPLLRKCTDPTDGHLDLPQFVRHLIGLYYITLLDPCWLSGSIPFVRFPQFSICALKNVLPFFLFREHKLMFVSKLPDKNIFAMVDKKLRHICQALKDDGDRAHWKPYKGEYEKGKQASQKNLHRLYGGNPLHKLERDAINDARIKGTLLLQSGKTSSNNPLRRRAMYRNKMDDWQSHLIDEANRIEDLVYKTMDQLECAENEKEENKLKRKLASLEKWQQKNYDKINQAERSRAFASHIGEEARLPFFHGLTELIKNNPEHVKNYIKTNKYQLVWYCSINRIINENYQSGMNGELYTKGYDLYRNLTPNGNSSAYSVCLLGAVKSGKQSIKDRNSSYTLQEFADKHQTKILKELARHGVIRHMVVNVISENAGYNSESQVRLRGKFLTLIGLDNIEDIKRLGQDYFEQSRKLLKQINALSPFTLDDIRRARAAYFSPLSSCAFGVVRGYRMRDNHPIATIPLVPEIDEVQPLEAASYTFEYGYI